ncbi:CRISPR-associated protein Cas4 [Salinisphaera hydrothermalis]|uniref:CRISPR-associated protein Cas4 n=1 Tax=Salinisphaera hydrothermalis TaxID=563188 RepID=UPI003341E02B
MATSDIVIPISALQHYLYCDRQCALIHIERIWHENRHTAEGRVLHERADRYGHEQRRGVHTAMALPLAHEQFGLSGYADVVEFEGLDVDRKVRPIEYKRGRPKAHRADEVQLCAQALCLEEMLECEIGEGALFYGQTKRRSRVEFDQTLRELTVQVIDETRSLLTSGRTPRATYKASKCDRCSLIDDCHPQAMSKKRTVGKWLAAAMAE